MPLPRKVIAVIVFAAWAALGASSTVGLVHELMTNEVDRLAAATENESAKVHRLMGEDSPLFDAISECVPSGALVFLYIESEEQDAATWRRMLLRRLQLNTLLYPTHVGLVCPTTPIGASLGAVDFPLFVVNLTTRELPQATLFAPVENRSGLRLWRYKAKPP